MLLGSAFSIPVSIAAYDLFTSVWEVWPDSDCPITEPAHNRGHSCVMLIPCISPMRLPLPGATIVFVHAFSYV